MKLALLLLSPALLLAQSSGWLGGGSVYTNSSGPKIGAWGALSLPVGALQSFTYYQATIARTPITSTTTGIADCHWAVTLKASTLRVCILATIGVSTSSSAAVLAGAMGGLGLWQWKSGLTAEVGWMEMKDASGSLRPRVVVGGGWAWGSRP